MRTADDRASTSACVCYGETGACSSPEIKFSFKIFKVEGEVENFRIG